ncbi:hypothetical protein HK100_007265, partial [Physocladia obscura]
MSSSSKSLVASAAAIGIDSEDDFEVPRPKKEEPTSEFELEDEACPDSASGKNNEKSNEESSAESEEFELAVVQRKRVTSSTSIIPTTATKKRAVDQLDSEGLDNDNTPTTIVSASSNAAPIVGVPIESIFKDDVVALSDDGRLHINGVWKQQIDSVTMAALRLIGDTSKLKLSNDVKSYPVSERTRIHVELAKSRLQSDYEYCTNLGCDALLFNYVMAQLDDDQFNFNLSNLKNVPAKVNAWSRKSKGQNKDSTRTGYKNSFRYKGRQPAQDLPSIAKTVLKTISLFESSEDVKAAIMASDVPFEADRDLVVYYCGMHGSSTQFIVENHVRNFKHGIRLTSGYVLVGRDMLHLMVLGRKMGEGDENGLEGTIAKESFNL